MFSPDLGGDASARWFPVVGDVGVVEYGWFFRVVVDGLMVGGVMVGEMGVNGGCVG